MEPQPPARDPTGVLRTGARRPARPRTVPHRAHGAAPPRAAPRRPARRPTAPKSLNTPSTATLPAPARPPQPAASPPQEAARRPLSWRPYEPTILDALNFLWMAIESGLLAIMVLVVTVFILFPVNVFNSFLCLGDDLVRGFRPRKSAFESGPCVNCGCLVYVMPDRIYAHAESQRPSGTEAWGCKEHDCKLPRIKKLTST